MSKPFTPEAVLASSLDPRARVYLEKDVKRLFRIIEALQKQLES